MTPFLPLLPPPSSTVGRPLGPRPYDCLIVTGALPFYLLQLPLYAIVMPIRALANLHDVSWAHGAPLRVRRQRGTHEATAVPSPAHPVDASGSPPPGSSPSSPKQHGVPPPIPSPLQVRRAIGTKGQEGAAAAADRKSQFERFRPGPAVGPVLRWPRGPPPSPWPSRPHGIPSLYCPWEGGLQCCPRRGDLQPPISGPPQCPGRSAPTTAVTRNPAGEGVVGEEERCH